MRKREEKKDNKKLEEMRVDAEENKERRGEIIHNKI